jgi:hypothetical protein
MDGSVEVPEVTEFDFLCSFNELIIASNYPALKEQQSREYRLRTSLTKQLQRSSEPKSPL